MFILNGRCNNDVDGEFTCKNRSVVDYCIADINFIKHLSDMCILPFSSIYSDVHNPILVTMKLDINTRNPTKDTVIIHECNNNSENPKKWNVDERFSYQNCVENK